MNENDSLDLVVGMLHVSFKKKVVSRVLENKRRRGWMSARMDT